MIEKYLDAFPFSNTYITQGATKAFFLKNMDGAVKLHCLNLVESKNYNDGNLWSEEDFSKRSFRHFGFNKKTNEHYIISDTDNKEDYNIFKLRLDSGTLEQVTKTSYCGIYGVDEEFETLVYGDRYKTENGKFFTKLYLMNLSTGESELLCDDSDWEYRFSWSSVEFSLDKSKIYFSLDKDNNRTDSNIYEFDLKSKKLSALLPKECEGPHLYLVNEHIDNAGLYFISNKSGHDNLYNFNLESQGVTQLTHFEENTSGFKMSPDNKTLHILVDRKQENKTLLVELKLAGDRVESREEITLEGSQHFLQSKDLWLSSTAMDNPGDIKLCEISEGKLVEKMQLNNVVGNLDDLIHNTYKFVEYPSFDGQMVPAFLSLPKKKVRAAIITSFYGGDNNYSWLTQAFAELGIAILSPGVRGSWSYGKIWREKILGDLGGDEILDVHWGAKFLEKELGLPCERIGVRGGSHGGYAVLRAMTMPENFKEGIPSSYPYGFGICWAGFADLEDFYKTSNIPDWLVNMLGPYEGNEQKYRERSPLHDFENLQAPLFIAHGLNDSRVSASSMEGFIEKLKASDKNYTLHIMEGLGHGGGNKQEEVDQYTKVFNFVESVLQDK
ncbi:prolyl oligopeptidase family serine peptidase [Bacteriovorax sp. DB6_IX]|uniref:S9 family peptidase n=1 Tax=Bacteriovorax sp. DB6_IX TaxID=1353530 RepID=UPI00038A200B|nr:prolyl oligopeptidase family serine peptidase [Bacteriovorax sp. DB6_IX]EQC51763.1 peptidase, S9A/B/C family, catalytic domain protein [Bacteriovorax sp. DB6_IX]